MPVTINGDGLIEVGGTSTTQGRVRLAEDTDNGSNYVELTAPASVTANRTVTFPDANVDFSTGLGVAQGGTGTTSLTANNVLLGNGTSAVQVVAPGASGNLLTSNGTTWTSAAPASSFVGFRGQTFTSNGTFTIPTGITAVKITVVGGGGGGGRGVGQACISDGFGGGGGGGGTAISYLTSLTPGNTLSVTVGAGGAGGTGGGGSAGGNSSVASGTQTISTITANGGSGGSQGSSIYGANGAGGGSSGGTINMSGSGGAGASVNVTGTGGSSTLGGGAVGRTLSSGAGNAGGLYGGGGSGGYSLNGASQNGGAGGAGVVIFEW